MPIKRGRHRKVLTDREKFERLDQQVRGVFQRVITGLPRNKKELIVEEAVARYWRKKGLPQRVQEEVFYKGRPEKWGFFEIKRKPLIKYQVRKVSDPRQLRAIFAKMKKQGYLPKR
jgi:hypothetical protein